MSKGRSVSVGEMASHLQLDIDTVREAIDRLCHLGYCGQITAGRHPEGCGKCSAGTCASLPSSPIQCWQISPKGIDYIRSSCSQLNAK